MTSVEKVLRRYMRRAGFSHYRMQTRALTREELQSAWMMCSWDVEEESVEFALPPDGLLPDDVLEMVCIHEVAHGICALAQCGEVLEEVACNRILRFLKPRAVLPNEWTRRMGGDNVEALRALTKEQRELVGLAIDVLPTLTPQDRELLNMRLYERASLAECARRLGWFLSSGEPDRKKVKRESERLTYAVGRAVKQAMEDAA